MSKFYFKILLCAGFGLYSFPVLSAERQLSKEQIADIPLSPIIRVNPSSTVSPSPLPSQASLKSGESPHARKRSDSDDLSARRPLMKDLQLVQKGRQAILADYPKVLTASQIATIVNSPYLDNRGSTQAIEVAPHLWVSVKVGDTAWRNLRKAVHPTYVATATGVGHQGFLLKSSTFEKLHVAYDEVIAVLPALTANFVDMIMFDYQGETVKAQKAKGGTDVKGEMARYQLMIGGIGLQYPVSSAGGLKMSDAYLPLSITFSQDKSEKAGEQRKDAKSTEGSLEKKEMRKSAFSPPRESPPPYPSVAPAQQEPFKKKPLPPAPLGSQSKEKGAPQAALAVPSKDGGEGVLRPRATSAPKPSAVNFMYKLKAAQADIQHVIREYPERLMAAQLELILNAKHDFDRSSTVPVKLEGSNFLISAKLTESGLASLRKAVSEDYIAGKIPFDVLNLARDRAIVYSRVVAYAGNYLQPVYTGQTVTTAQSDGSAADGTLMQYMLKVGEKPLTYPDKGDAKMITAILELSITRIDGPKQ